ncbi:MAG TPA: CDP-diacylglycerol--serine O-phosphatidyltransferase [Chitinophagaceae bacterium]|nr:CDP-diacylglycerol--serine O-phosphatidyltransferase [Chitinophagaceae bacterium]
MKQIANLFTLLNLVFGCIAIVFILQTGQSIVYVQPDGFTSWDMPEKIAMGSLFIFAAGIIDFLDGFVARLLKASSDMGKQLDSLADMVSFGVAPGLILYQLLRISFAKETDGLDVSIAALLPAFLVPCAAAWRLAKFNIDDSQQHSFKGIPTPAAGITIASLPLIIHYQQFNLQQILFNQWLIYGIIILLSYLMVSNISLMSLKFKESGLKNNAPKLVLAAITIVAALVLQWVAIPVVLLAYVIVSLAFKNKIA